MTPLLKRVTRKTTSPYRVLYNSPRHIVATLAPGDIIEFREAGRRATYSLPLDFVFKMAVRAQTEAALKKKREAKRKNKLLK